MIDGWVVETMAARSVGVTTIPLPKSTSDGPVAIQATADPPGGTTIDLRDQVPLGGIDKIDPIEGMAIDPIEGMAIDPIEDTVIGLIDPPGEIDLPPHLGISETHLVDMVVLCLLPSRWLKNN